MGRWKSEEERLKLGERAVYLRDEEKLLWKDIAERLGIPDVSQTTKYYRKYKDSLLTAKSEMSFEKIMEFSREHRIEPGWVWLYERGFKHRVPLDVQSQIENAKLGISHKSGRPPLLKVDKRRWPQKRGREPIKKKEHRWWL